MKYTKYDVEVVTPVYPHLPGPPTPSLIVHVYYKISSLDIIMI